MQTHKQEIKDLTEIRTLVNLESLSHNAFEMFQ